jgi:hypothetical protein
MFVSRVLGWASRQSTGSVGVCMRIVGLALFALLVTVPAEATVAGLDRTTACKPLAERGRAWADCCTQSYSRNPSRAMPRRARLRHIERCVRTKLRT